MKIFRSIGLFILFISLFTPQSSQAQVSVKAKGGSFEDLVPWGEGYIGIVQTQMYAVAPKYRQFQYFSSAGELEWNVKVTPFNFNNAGLINNDADYAYYINMPFSKTAMVEKTSKTELLNIYRIDRSGNLVEKPITYTGDLKPMAAIAKKIYACYLGAYKDGIIFVGTADNLKYHVVRIDNDFNVTYHPVEFEWDEKVWEKNGISKVKYVLGENEFSMIQMKLEGSDLVTTIKTFDLKDFSDPKKVTNTVSFSGYNLYSDSGSDIDYSADESVWTSYERTKWKGDNLYIYPTLGAFTNYEYSDNGLKMYAYYKNIKSGTKNQVEKEGFVTYDLDNSADADIEPTSDFDFDSEKYGSKSHAFHMTPDGQFIFITQQSKSNTILKTSDGDEMKFDEKLSFAEVYLSYVTGETRTKSDAVDVISIVGNKYVGIDFDGITNSFGNTPKAVIYRY